MLYLCHRLLYYNDHVHHFPDRPFVTHLISLREKEEKDMISNSKRLFYQTCLIAVICFLCATISYDLEEAGIVPIGLVIAVMLDLLGCLLTFKAFVYVCYPDEYDHYEEVYPCNHYAPLFYVIAGTMTLATMFLLLLVVKQYESVQQEQGMLLWGVVVIIGCLLIGRSSQRV
jgi:hypothetical protein